MVHFSSMLQNFTVILYFLLAAFHDFIFETYEVRQAHLQSDDPLENDAFLSETPGEFELKPEDCIQLLKL